MLRSLCAASCAVALVACNNAGPTAVAPPTPTATATPPSASALATPTASTPTDPPKPSGPAPAVRYTGLETPESVLYDELNDRYLVSNVNGGLRDDDNNGFISALSPDGKITSLKLIEGGKNGVKLDAPKGMAIAKGVLYVADVRVVRMFDLASGAPKGDIAIPKATFLNDVAAGPDGRVYVSDSGMKLRGKEIDRTQSDSIWIVEQGRARALAQTPELNQPNGIAWTSTGIVVVGIGAAEIYRLDAKGAKADVTKLAKGGLDGVVALPGDVFLVSSGEASAIYKGKLGGAFELVLPGQIDAADIGYDTKRGRVLVPRMTEHAVEAHDLK